MNDNFIPPLEFFDLLSNHTEFCCHLGKLMLAAGTLETTIKNFLRAKNVAGIREKSTLGGLVKLLKEQHLLSYNGMTHFDGLVAKRNYLTHSLYDLFSESTAETVLPRTNLSPEDVELFIEKTEDLTNDFKTFSKIVQNTDISAAKII